METAISKINEFDLDKDQINDFIDKVCDEALDTFDSGGFLKLRRNIKVLTEITKGIEERLKHDFLEEANKHGKEFTVDSAKFTVKIRTTPDFRVCNDSKLNDAIRIKKERETFLKALKVQFADPNTGEIINPPIYKSTEYIEIKL